MNQNCEELPTDSSRRSAAQQILDVPEVLAHILNHCDRHELAKACAVHSTWGATIGELTHFGATVEYHPKSPAGVQTFARNLLQSGRRLVNIWVPWIDSRHEAPVLDLIREHSSRIVRMVIRQLSSTGLQLVWSAISCGMPVIKELVLHGAADADIGRAISSTLSFADLARLAPRLHHLVSSGVFIHGHQDAGLFSALEYVMHPLTPDDKCNGALTIWTAPWPSPVTGVSIREDSDGDRESWVATAWDAAHALDLSDEQLAGHSVKMVAVLQSSYRRVVFPESFRAESLCSWRDQLTVLSMPLFFWGLVRAEVGDIVFPNLKTVHVILVELHDDVNEHSGTLICPRLRHIGLQVERIQSEEWDRRKWKHVLRCTHHAVQSFAARIFDFSNTNCPNLCFKSEEIFIDLIGNGFDLMGASRHQKFQVRTQGSVHSFESWFKNL